MTMECFRKRDFGIDARLRIQQCNDVIDEFLGQGFTLTLRQLYYQLVSADLIPNSENSYKNLGSLVSDARLAGLIDWDAIEDRGRVARIPHNWENVDDIIHAFKSSVKNYKLPRWRGQPYYVELWVEKDALAGVLSPLAEKHHVPLMVNKGYSSQSAMYESAQRFIREMDHETEEGEKRRGVLLYLGDHDPSGEDMVRDVRERLAMFGASVNVVKIALTMEQVRKYQPPPNPAKVTDSRAAAYIAKHGNKSWEVDALKPPVLAALIETEVVKWQDPPALRRVLRHEERDKRALMLLLSKMNS